MNSTHKRRKLEADDDKENIDRNIDNKDEQERLVKEEKDLQRAERIAAARKANEMYIQLGQKLVKIEPQWGSVMLETPNPEISARNMQYEVYDGERDETVHDWEQRAEQMQLDDGDWSIDYIICCEKRKLGDDRIFGKEKQVLIKWSRFPVPTWESTKKLKQGKNTKDFLLRLLLLDCVELDIRLTHGDAFFKEMYPNRYLPYELGRGDYGYVEEELALYKNRLRANEHYYNVINARFNRAFVYVEDWTGLPHDDEALKQLEWIQIVLFSSDVQAMQSQQPQGSFHHLKCSDKCDNCSTERTNRTKTIRYCCGMANTIEIDTNDRPYFIENGRPRVHGVDTHLFFAECTDACRCDENVCANRVVQRGRKKPLLIFRETIKGWGIRFLTEFEQHDFVCEYTGELMLERKEEGRERDYDFDLIYKARREDGEKKRLIINAYEKGNESRFISHACEPNLDFWLVAVDRIGLPFCRSALYTRRDIVRGEEASVDYYGGRSLGEDGVDAQWMFPETGCACESSTCRFTAQLIADFKQKYGIE